MTGKEFINPLDGGDVLRDVTEIELAAQSYVGGGLGTHPGSQ